MKNMARLGLILVVAMASPPLLRARQAHASRAARADHSTGPAAESPTPVYVGGEPVVTLSRPAASETRPRFVSATILPGEGMNLLLLKAWLPGSGAGTGRASGRVVDVIASPDLEDAKRMIEYGNDAFGNENFRLGAAILLPYPNRIRGAASPDGETIVTTIQEPNGKQRQLILPASWHGPMPGSPLVAMHGLILQSKFRVLNVENTAALSSVTATLHAGNFGGHWPSKTDVLVKAALRSDALDLTVTATNAGTDLLPMAIGWHPYFNLPSGDRAQARLHLPAGMLSVADNYNNVFPRGVLDSVKNTSYAFTAASGAPLGSLFMDDCFTDLRRGRDGSATIEITDPAAHYGVRMLALSPRIKAIQVYAPRDEQYVVVEPQFNLNDPFNKAIWHDTDTGIVWLQPGKSVSWHVRLELVTPAQ